MQKGAIAEQDDSVENGTRSPRLPGNSTPLPHTDSVARPSGLSQVEGVETYCMRSENVTSSLSDIAQDGNTEEIVAGVNESALMMGEEKFEDASESVPVCVDAAEVESEVVAMDGVVESHMQDQKCDTMQPTGIIA